MLMEMIGLILLISISTYIPKRMRRMTRVAVLLLLAESICYNLELWTQSFEKLSILRPILTSCVYSLYPIILYFILRIVLDENMSKKKIFLLLLPEIVSVPLYFTSQWTHIVFWFSQGNHYVAGPLGRLPYAVFFFYSLMFLYQNYVFFRSFNGKDQMTAAYIILMPMLGVLLLQLFRDGGDYGALLTSAILLYFAFIYINLAKIDPLTGLLNRKSCFDDQQRSKSISAVVSVDLNDLKALNDSRGHGAGDEALKTVADVLRKYCGQGGTVYRVGGDQFVILYSRVEESWVASAVDIMRQELGQTPYSCSFGYAMVAPGRRVDDALVAADHAMYADKETLKRRQGGAARSPEQASPG